MPPQTAHRNPDVPWHSRAPPRNLGPCKIEDCAYANLPNLTLLKYFSSMQARSCHFPLGQFPGIKIKGLLILLHCHGLLLDHFHVDLPKEQLCVQTMGRDELVCRRSLGVVELHEGTGRLAAALKCDVLLGADPDDPKPWLRMNNSI